MASGKVSTKWKGYELITEWHSMPNQSNNFSDITCTHKLKCDAYWGLDIGGRENSFILDADEKHYNSPNIYTQGGETINLGQTTHRIKHNSDGKKSCRFKNTFYLRAEILGQYQEKIEFEGEITLDDIPRYASIAEIKDFTDEQDININFNNSGSFDLKFELFFNNQLIASRNKPTKISPYKFVLTEAEREELRLLSLNSKFLNLKVTIASYNNKNQISNWSSKYVKMNIINATPIINSNKISIYDTNPITVGVTEDSNKMIQNLSHISCGLVVGDAIELKKHANINRIYCVLNGIVQNMENSGLAYSTTFENINSSTNIKIKIVCVDSRGFESSIEKDVEFIEYDTPKLVVDIHRLNNFENKTYFKPSASFSSLNNKNNVSIRYKYAKVNEDFSDVSVAVGMNLSGETINLDFPIDEIIPEISANDDKIIISTENYTIKEHFELKNVTGPCYYIKIYKNNEEYGIIFTAEGRSLSGDKPLTFNLPEDFGNVIFIDPNLIAYQHIKVGWININNYSTHELDLDNEFAWKLKIIIVDKIGSTTVNVPEAVAIGKPLCYWDIVKLSMAINGFPEHEKSLEIFGDLYVNGTKINSD